jgi:hypothetical protein
MGQKQRCSAWTDSCHRGQFLRFGGELDRLFDQFFNEQIDSLDLFLDLADESLV